MKYIDLFAGIGGFHYGIDQACRGVEDERQAVLGLRTEESEGEHNTRTRLPLSERHSWLLGDGTRSADCVYSNEWDKYANSVYRRHYGECDNRDIRNVEASEIPDFDLLCGGFPCQAFSVAGKRGGFDDTRGTLFFEVARILKEKQPRLLVLENVKGLLSHDSGRTFKVILATLTELGYDAQWQVLNSKNFGVPQNRERVYIVGHLRGTPRPEVFPITSTNPEDIKSDIKRKTEVFPTIRATHYKSGDNQPLIRQLNNPTHSNDRIYGEDGISPTLNTMQGGRRQPKIANTIDANYYKGINANPGHHSSLRGYEINGLIRRLTPTECMRLQGFPDDWCDLGAEGETISDSQKYKMAGNAVTTNVVTEVVKRLLTGDNPEEAK